MSARGAAAAQPRPQPSTPARERQRPRAAPRSRRRRRIRLRIHLGLTVIPVVAVLFAGVVWVNSVELRITKKQGQVARQITQVQEQLSSLTAAEASSNERVRAAAEGSLGMKSTSSDELTFLTARPGR